MALKANALTTVVTLESELGLSSGSKTAILERLIGGISDAVEKYCARSFGRATVLLERYPGFGSQRLMLKRTPLVTIEAILLDTDTIDSTSYYIEDAEAGFVYRSAGWANTAALSSDVQPRRIPGTEEKAFIVSYTAGYVLPTANSGRDLPFDIEQAVIIGCVSLYRARGKYSGMSTETEDGDAKPWYDYPLPPNARQLLNLYRRVRG